MGVSRGVAARLDSSAESAPKLQESTRAVGARACTLPDVSATDFERSNSWPPPAGVLDASAAPRGSGDSRAFAKASRSAHRHQHKVLFQATLQAGSGFAGGMAHRGASATFLTAPQQLGRG